MDGCTGAVGAMAPSHVGAAVGSWAVWAGKHPAEHDRTQLSSQGEKPAQGSGVQAKAHTY